MIVGRPHLLGHRHGPLLGEGPEVVLLHLGQADGCRVETVVLPHLLESDEGFVDLIDQTDDSTAPCVLQKCMHGETMRILGESQDLLLLPFDVQSHLSETLDVDHQLVEVGGIGLDRPSQRLDLVDERRLGRTGGGADLDTEQESDQEQFLHISSTEIRYVDGSIHEQTT